MFRLPAALMLSRCGSIFYMTENPMAYVAADGRKIQLRAACADDVSIPKPGGPLSGFGRWNLAPGYIRNDCLYIGTPRGELEPAEQAERIAVWALYEAGVQLAPARLSLARSASISSSMSATSAASSGAAS